MDKNNIKKRLSERFLSEESTPGIKVTADMRKKSGEINKKGVGAEAKDAIDYNKSLKQDKDTSKMAPNKFNYTDDFEKTYHDEMEIMNGQEMIQYDRVPNKEFKDRAEEAIAGSSRMGNNPEWANVVEKQQGFEGPEFGKNLVKKIKASMKKRGAETPAISLRGKDIQELPDKKVDNGHKPIAIEENNTNNNKPQIKESMKRLKFKKEFNGVGNALKLIPEAYKVDKKEFEMTDGNETYRIRWEGTLSEGSAVVLTANDKKLVNEDIQRMKALFGYKSQETLGLVKGNARIDENKIFGDIWNKSKKLLGESEDIEGQDAEKEAPFEEADVNHAPEAKKHIEGSVSQSDLGGTAPKPKVGEWDKITKKAAEATKDIEGSVSQSDLGGVAPKPKEGNWEEISKKASEATEHMESGKSTNKATDKAKVVAPAKSAVNENIEGEDDDDDADDDTDDYNKPDADDDSMSDDEPTGDIPAEVPSLGDEGGDDEEDTVKVPMPPKAGAASLAFSPSLQAYWIKGPGLPLNGMQVPAELESIAADKSKKGFERANLIIKKLQDMEFNEPEGGEEELDEYGDEHPISTDDAVKSMKPGAVAESKKAKK